MDRRRIGLVVILVIVSAGFCWGVAALMTLRFERGDIYPVYSTYRTDPRGCKALLEGLGLSGAVRATRNTEPLSSLKDSPESALFIIGLEESQFSHMAEATARGMEATALKGGRLVISFAPVRPKERDEGRGSGAALEKGKEQGKKGSSEKEKTTGPDGAKKTDRSNRTIPTVDLGERWGIKGEHLPTGVKEASLTIDGASPSLIRWLNPLAFRPADGAWSTLGAVGGRPVLLERPFGNGQIVLLSDSFLLTNEAMKTARNPRLLAWLCGNLPVIIFDETHLGVSESPGIAAVIRRNGLFPFFASLVLLAALAVWRQSAAFLPPSEPFEDVPSDQGRGYSAGLANLFRRNIPRERILATCVEEWERSFSHGREDLAALVPKAKEIVAAYEKRQWNDRSLLQAYREIGDLVARKKISRRSHG
jgi:hypothetical protein